ncbi:MAG TPA: thiosulfate oxidation carrier complex protein SoxZ [Candidatus Methylomirabilis sp.]|nr:thiosulfate oxidation carrier complex protein SoxZ [Candidatus Methylomirabilis sp.]
MVDRKMKMRTRMQDGVVELQVLITHPMETGLRTDKNTGKKIPPHFIQKVTIELNGKAVAVVDSGTGVSEDPLLGFRLKGAKNGDKLKAFWTDNMGESGTLEGAVDVS